MFDFLKPKPKSPADFLESFKRKLVDMDDLKKMPFLKQNLSHVIEALENDPQRVIHYQSVADRAQNVEAKVTEEWSSGYLNWHYSILANLGSANTVFNVKYLSDESQIFLNATRAKAGQAFDELFALNPVEAIQSICPHELFKTEVQSALATLVSHDDPQLFFDCVDAVYFKGTRRAVEVARARFTNEITDLTILATQNLLEKSPQDFINPRSDWAYGKEITAYTDYLPEGVVRRLFIQDNIDKISSIVREIAPNATDDHHNTFNAMWSAFYDDEEPAELAALKKLLSSERLKTLFSLAADPDRPNLSKLVYTVLSKEWNSELVRHTGEGDESGYEKPYTFLRVTNPDASPDAEDKDLGANSKHLWILKKPQIILATSFAAADMRNYLQCQRANDDAAVKVEKFDEFVTSCQPKLA